MTHCPTASGGQQPVQALIWPGGWSGRRESNPLASLEDCARRSTARSLGPSCEQSRRRRITRCGGRSMTTSSTVRNDYRCGIPGLRTSPTPKPTRSNISASPAVASSSRGSGPARPLKITAQNAASSFGNSSKPLASNPPTIPTTGHASGNAQHPPTLTYQPDFYCFSVPSPNASDGKLNTPPPNLPPTAYDLATVR